jgi:hypothetical protein
MGLNGTSGPNGSKWREGFIHGDCALLCSANQAPASADRMTDSRAPRKGEFSISNKPYFQLKAPFKIANFFIKIW